MRAVSSAGWRLFWGYAGIRAIPVRAISEDAKRFYEKHGLVSSPVDPMTLMITPAEARKMLTQNQSPA